MQLPLQHIQIFALSRTPSPDVMEAGLATLRSWGIAYQLPQLAPQRYLATTSADEFNRQLALPCEAMISARGGYGCLRLLEQIDFELLVRKNVPIMGYSDVCALHLAAYAHGAKRQIHGPMICNQFGNMPEFTLNSLQKCLQNQDPFIPHGLAPLKCGTATAPIVATNFAMLCTLLGTRFMPDLTDTILAVEDIGEPAYKIDRMLTQLRLCGILKRLKGLVFGQFTEAEDGEYIPEIMKEFSEYIAGPVATNLQFGHCQTTLSIPLGAPVTLTVTQDTARLTLANRE